MPLGSLSLVLHSWNLKTIYLALDLFQDTFRALVVSHSCFLTLFLMSACSLKSWESFLSWELYRCQQSGCMHFPEVFHMLKTSLCVPWVWNSTIIHYSTVSVWFMSQFYSSFWSLNPMGGQHPPKQPLRWNNLHKKEQKVLFPNLIP